MPFNIKVGGAWKQGTGAKVKVGGAWKTVESIQVKVGGAWKVAFTNSITPSISATVTPNPSAFSQDVTIQGFVLPVPTGGTVLVRDSNDNPIGTQDNVDISTGEYSITIPDQAVGTYTFSVNYSGFGLYQPVSTNATVNVGTIPTTTTLTTSAASYVYNATRVTLSGTVSPTPLTGGTVTISNISEGTIGVADVSVVNGSYSLLVPVKDVGSYTNIIASYGGSGNYAVSVSGTTSYSVTQASTALTATTSSSSVQAGSSVTLTGTLTTAGVNLSGRTITFQGLNSSSVWTNLGTGNTNASGVATFAWTTSSGFTQIRAVYAGETNYSGQTSAGVAISIFTTIATTTSIARSAASYTYNGTRVTISGTISPTPTGGTVAIKSGTTTLATATVNTSTGAYSALMPVQNAGSYTVTSEYSGFGGLYLASTSGSTSYTVDQASTALTTPGSWGSAGSASAINSGTTITSSVTLTTGGTAFGSQSVTFQKSSGASYVDIATVQTNSSGVASVTWTPSAGSQDVRAVYTATTNYAGVTSGLGSGYARTQYSATYDSGAVQNDYQFRGCNVNTAEQVASTFTMPNNAPNGIASFDYVVTSMTVRVSGYNGESGSIKGCIWNNNAAGTTLVTSSGFERPATSALGTMRTVTCNLTDASVTKGESYMAGFWREDANCSYTTQWGFDNNFTGVATYYDNSASAPGTFDKNSTFTSDSLIFTVSYTYWV